MKRKINGANIRLKLKLTSSNKKSITAFKYIIYLDMCKYNDFNNTTQYTKKMMNYL